MAYRTLLLIHHFLHIVCANVLRLPPVACRIDQHSFGSMVRTRISMLEPLVLSFFWWTLSFHLFSGLLLM